MRKDPVSEESFKEALKIIDAQRRLLILAGADASMMCAYEAIVRYLNKLPRSQLNRLVGVHARVSPLETRRAQEEREAASMSLADVDEAIQSETVSRLSLEAIAIGRFQVPRGSIRSLGDLDHLRTQLKTLVENERAHESISAVARDYG